MVQHFSSDELRNEVDLGNRIVSHLLTQISPQASAYSFSLFCSPLLLLFLSLCIISIEKERERERDESEGRMGGDDKEMEA